MALHKPATWEDCVRCVKPGHDGLKDEADGVIVRPDEYNEIYKQQRARNNKLYVSYPDFIKHKFMSHNVEVVVCKEQDGDKTIFVNKLQIIKKEEGYKFFVIKRNDFPYLVERPMAHFVIFSTYGLNKKEVEDEVEEKYPNMEYVWWQNPVNKRSIPEIWHVHVIVKLIDKKLDLLITGYLRQNCYKNKNYKLPGPILLDLEGFYSFTSAFRDYHVAFEKNLNEERERNEIAKAQMSDEKNEANELQNIKKELKITKETLARVMEENKELRDKIEQIFSISGEIKKDESTDEVKDEVRDFLENNKYKVNLPEYYYTFKDSGFETMDGLRELTDKDLVEMKISKKAHRFKILKGIRIASRV